MTTPSKPRKARAPKAGTYTDPAKPLPDSEKIDPADIAHGFRVGDTVEFVEDFADDVPAGRRAEVEALDTHPFMPITVRIHIPGGGFIFGVPVKAAEVRKVTGDTPDAPEAVSGPSEAPEGPAEPQAVSA